MDAYISANPAAAAFAAVFTAAAAIAVSCESPDGAKATFGRRGARLFFPPRLRRPRARDLLWRIIRRPTNTCMKYTSN
jgi:hypothetical protein